MAVSSPEPTHSLIEKLNLKIRSIPSSRRESKNPASTPSQQRAAPDDYSHSKEASDATSFPQDHAYRKRGSQSKIYSNHEQCAENPPTFSRPCEWRKHMDKPDRSPDRSFEDCRTRGFLPRPAPAKLFDPQHSPSTTTRIYDPRTHIFRSKKAYEYGPERNPLSAPGRHGTQDHSTNSSAAEQRDGLGTRTPAEMAQSSSPSEFVPERCHQPQAPWSFLPYDNFHDRDPSLLLQPETRPISQEQLVNEVKGIYAGLVMVEKKCVETDNQQAQTQAEGRQIKLSHEQWQALIALHRTLLHEHHDFFLASQHPSASPALRKLAAKYAMPARMWRHGIHSFLELLRHRLPDSLDHMLAFIYLAYSMMALLKESVPAFEDTWIECLGDLARYRMAIEDEDLRDREVWSGVARYWYNKAADKSPRIGRIQHHLAVLARPNALQQLFCYTRALTCIQPFLNARESILTLFNPILEDYEAVIHRCPQIDIAFIKAHGILFKQGPLPAFDEHTEKFLSLLDNNIVRVTAKWREQDVWIVSSNPFGIGSTDILFLKLSQILTDNPSCLVELAKSTWIFYRQDSNPASSDSALVHASQLTFSVLVLALLRVRDKNVVPHTHVFLVSAPKYWQPPFDSISKVGLHLGSRRRTTKVLSCNQTSKSRSSTSVHERTILFRVGDAVHGVYDTATEAFKTYWNCSARLMHGIFSSNKLASLLIKLWLLCVAIPVAAGLPVERDQPTSRAKSSTYSDPLSPTQASGPVISPVRLSVEDILFMALAAISPVGFHMFGKWTGNQLLATGAAMIPANIVHLMTWEDGSIGTIGRLSTLFLALLSTGAFGRHVFHEFPHMGFGHGIAIFFSTVGLVWLCPRGSSSDALIGGQTDSPTQYILPCLAASLVCWYRMAPHTEPYSRPRATEQVPILPTAQVPILLTELP